MIEAKKTRGPQDVRKRDNEPAAKREIEAATEGVEKERAIANGHTNSYHAVEEKETRHARLLHADDQALDVSRLLGSWPVPMLSSEDTA